MPVIKPQHLLEHAGVLDKASLKMDGIRRQILSFASNTELFDERITSQFSDSKDNYPLDAKDPTQVTILKKVLNKIGNLQERVDAVTSHLKSIDDTDLSEDGLLYGGSRYVYHGVATGFDSLRLLNVAKNEAVDLINMLNESPIQLKQILGPIYDQIFDMVQEGSKAIGIEETQVDLDVNLSGEDLAQGIGKLLGTESQELEGTSVVQTVASQLFKIPALLNDLNNAVTGEDIGIYDLDKLNNRVDKVHNLVDKLLKDENSTKRFGHTVKLLDKCYRLVRNVFEAGRSSTDETCAKAIESLNSLKQEYIPKLIAEVEKVEQSLGLKPGVLSSKVMEQVSQLYDNAYQFAEKSKKINQEVKGGSNKNPRALLAQVYDMYKRAGDPIKTPPLQDNIFYASRERIFNEQLGEVDSHLDTLAEQKAESEAFFDKVNELNTNLSTGKVNDISIEDKLDLRVSYQKIQEYVAQQSPALDKEIVSAVNISDQERIDAIKNLELNTEQKNLLASSLNDSVSTAISAIDKMDIDPEKKSMLKKLVNDPQCIKSGFTDEIRKIPEPVSSNVLFSFARKAVSGVIAAASVVKHKALRVAFLSSNELTAISKHKDAVNNHIQQDIANASFKKGTMESQKEQALSNHLDIINEKQEIHIEAIEKPFERSGSNNHGKTLSYDELRESKNSALKDRNQLAIFKESANSFFEKVERMYGDNDHIEMTFEQRVSLYKDFVSFQSFTAATDPQSRIMENRLMKVIAEGRDITRSSMQDFKEEINSKLEKMSQSVEKDIEDIDEQLKTANYSLDSLEQADITCPTLLHGIKDSIRSSVSMFNSLQLDEKISAFKNDTLLPTLKNSLSEDLLKKLDLDNNKPPIKITKNHTSKEKNYLKLINGIYALENVIGLFKTLTSESAIKNILMNPSKLKALLRKGEIQDLISLAHQFDGIPEFKGVWQKVKDMIAPLKSLPFIGDKINSLEEKVEKKYTKTFNPDAKLESKETAERSDTIEAIEQTDENSPSKLKEFIDDMQNFKEALVGDQPTQAPVEDNTEELYQDLLAINDLKANLKKLDFGFKDLQVSGNAVNDLFKELANIGHLGKEAVLKKLSNFSDEFMFEALSACDITEVKMGLKPGTLSKPLMEKMNNFYANIIAGLPMDEAEKSLSMTAVEEGIAKQLTKRLDKVEEYIAKKVEVTTSKSSELTEEQRNDLMQDISLAKSQSAYITETHAKQQQTLSSQRVEKYKVALLKANISSHAVQTLTEESSVNLNKKDMQNLLAKFVEKKLSEFDLSNIKLSDDKTISTQIDEVFQPSQEKISNEIIKAAKNLDKVNQLISQIEALNSTPEDIENKNDYDSERQSLIDARLYALKTLKDKGLISDQEIKGAIQRVEKAVAKSDNLLARSKAYNALKSDTSINSIESLKSILSQDSMDPALLKKLAVNIMKNKISEFSKSSSPFTANVEKFLNDNFANIMGDVDFDNIALDSLDGLLDNNFSSFIDENQQVFKSINNVAALRTKLVSLIDATRSNSSIDKNRADFCQKIVDKIDEISQDKSMGSIERIQKLDSLNPNINTVLNNYAQYRHAEDELASMKASVGKQSNTMSQHIGKLSDILNNESVGIQDRVQQFRQDAVKPLPLFKDNIGGKIKGFFYKIHKGLFGEKAADKLYLSKDELKCKQKLTQCQQDIAEQMSSTSNQNTTKANEAEIKLALVLNTGPASSDKPTKVASTTSNNHQTVQKKTTPQIASTSEDKNSTSREKLISKTKEVMDKINNLMMSGKAEDIPAVVDELISDLAQESDQTLVEAFKQSDKRFQTILEAKEKTIDGMPKAATEPANDNSVDDELSEDQTLNASNTGANDSPP